MGGGREAGIVGVLSQEGHFHPSPLPVILTGAVEEGKRFFWRSSAVRVVDVNSQLENGCFSSHLTSARFFGGEKVARSLKVGILGASGYTGCELLRLLSNHPHMEVSVVVGRSDAGKVMNEIFPSLGGVGSLTVSAIEDAREDLLGCDLVFSALPHGQLATLFSEEPETLTGIERLVDLASDFRLRDARGYLQWYGSPHPCPERLSEWVYSVPEWSREAVAVSRRVANAGCFATAYILGVAPLVREGLVEGPLSGVGISGSSGAGKGLSPRLHLSHLHEDIVTYRVGGHQHGGEIEQFVRSITGGHLPGPVSLSTVLAPMSRGLQVIVTACASARAGAAIVKHAFRAAYDREPFVIVRDTSPETKHVRGAHRAEIFSQFDDRTGLITVVTVIDNLVKGAAGSAIQNANLMLGLDEQLGLPTVAMYP